MKNKFLLLGATALLSTGAIKVYAGVESAQGEIQAYIAIIDPLVVGNPNTGEGSSQFITFPMISRKNPAGSGQITVVMNPDGTIDKTTSNAQILAETGDTSSNGVLVITGGDIPNWGAEDGSTSTQKAAFSLSYSVADIEMKDNNTHCGTVKNFTPLWTYKKPSGGTPSVELKFGATFEYEADGTRRVSSCSGLSTITFFAYQ